MRHLDLFSGIGGFALGLERAGFETVAFCEIEEYPRKVLAKHWPHVPIYEDVRDVTKARLESDGITDIGIITGGFPCQDISTARTNNDVNGYRRGIDGEKSGLWGECSRILGDFRPEFAVFENVSALLSGNNGEWFKRVLWDISSVGYDAVWFCISASSIGAPHHRNRVWIICYPNMPGESTSPLNDETQMLQGNGAYTDQAQCKGRRISSRIHQEHTNIGNPCWGRDKPGVDRTLDGVSGRMDRLRGLGNAVVPQIPELIGRAILEAEK